MSKHSTETSQAMDAKSRGELPGPPSSTNRPFEDDPDVEDIASTDPSELAEGVSKTRGAGPSSTNRPFEDDPDVEDSASTDPSELAEGVSKTRGAGPSSTNRPFEDDPDVEDSASTDPSELAEGVSKTRGATPTSSASVRSVGNVQISEHTSSSETAILEVQPIHDERKDTRIPRSGLIDIFRKHLGNDEEKEEVLKLFIDDLRSDLSDVEKGLIYDEVKMCRRNFEAKWKKSGRYWKRFSTNHQKFLDGLFRLPACLFSQPTTLELDEVLDVGTVEQTTPPHGTTTQDEPRKRKRSSDWEKYGDRQQRRLKHEAEQIVEGLPVEAVTGAAARIAKKEGKSDLAEILKMATISPCRPSKMLQAMNTETVQVRNLTPEEALALILEKNLTKDTYQCIRELAVSCGLKNYYPPYKKITEAKRQSRPPSPPSVTDIMAEMPLQDLLDHTAQRIVQLQDEVLIAYKDRCEYDSLTLTLKCSWGFDGSTGHSIYKQRLESDEDDHSLLATTIIPLKMECGRDSLWINKTPQSYRWCRPLRLRFVKEKKEIILSEKDSVESQIQLLIPKTMLLSDGTEVKVLFELFLTIIDGKVSSIISGASGFQSCGVCKSTPSQFNQIDQMIAKPVRTDTLAYGISPLHLWIRSFEFCLHLGYKNEEGLKTWRGGKDSAQYRTRSQRIRTQLKDEFNLIVDMPRAGGAGTSNDGNTARRAFSDINRAKFAQILGLENWLVDGLHTILVAIDSCLPIDAEKFGKYCLDLARRYEKEYKWYYMPVTIHRLWIHGADIIKYSTLPLGMLSEQAGETQNKMYKRYREHNTRKQSRIHTLTDLFNRCMDASDPISNQFFLDRRVKRAKKFPLPESARALLLPLEDHFAKQVLTDRSDNPEEEHVEDDVTYSFDAERSHGDQFLEAEENPTNFTC